MVRCSKSITIVGVVAVGAKLIELLLESVIVNDDGALVTVMTGQEIAQPLFVIATDVPDEVV